MVDGPPDIRPRYIMGRILRNDRSGRQPVHLHIDQELLGVLNEHQVANKSDIVNVALEVYLRGKGWMEQNHMRNSDARAVRVPRVPKL